MCVCVCVCVWERGVGRCILACVRSCDHACVPACSHNRLQACTRANVPVCVSPNVRWWESSNGCTVVTLTLLCQDLKLALISMLCEFLLFRYETTARIRRFEEMRSSKRPICIIGMTADVDDAAIRQCHASGMDGVVGKPVDAAKLLKALYTK